MKKIILLFALIVATISCKDDDDKYTSDPNACVIEVPCGEPNGLISVQKAQEMEDYYKQEFYSYFNEIKGAYPGYDGAMRDVWFDLDELKKYIVYVENYAKENGHSNLGLRVYFGAEDKLGQDGQIYPRQTVFFVPTASSGSGFDNTNNNLTGLQRLDFGTGGIPDSVNSSDGMP